MNWDQAELNETKDAQVKMLDWMRSEDYLDPRAAAEREHKACLEREIMEYYAMAEKEVAADQPLFRRMLAYSMRGIKGLEKELKRIAWAESCRMNGRTPERLSDAEIYRAKEYPIDKLIQPVRGHIACCPFHKEKHPSMTLKNNFAYCFVCAKSWDTIALTMELEGLNFREAVKGLQG